MIDHWCGFAELGEKTQSTRGAWDVERQVTTAPPTDALLELLTNAGNDGLRTESLTFERKASSHHWRSFSRTRVTRPLTLAGNSPDRMSLRIVDTDRFACLAH